MIRFDPAVFVDHFRFIRWGDEQVLAAGGSISEEEYYRERGIAQGSLHKLTTHMMGSQWMWLSRFRGTPLLRIPDQTEYPTRDALVARWPLVHAEVAEFLAAQTEQSLGKTLTTEIRGARRSLQLGRFVQHLLDHGTYHRGQFNSMLKMAGGEPLALSMFPFYEKEGSE